MSLQGERRRRKRRRRKIHFQTSPFFLEIVDEKMCVLVREVHASLEGGGRSFFLEKFSCDIPLLLLVCLPFFLRQNTDLWVNQPKNLCFHFFFFFSVCSFFLWGSNTFEHYIPF